MFEFLKIVFPIFPGVHLVFLASAVSSKQYDFEILCCDCCHLFLTHSAGQENHMHT